MYFGGVMWLDEWMYYSGEVMWSFGIHCWDEHMLPEVWMCRGEL